MNTGWMRAHGGGPIERAIFALRNEHAPCTDFVAQEECEVLLAPYAWQRLLESGDARGFGLGRNVFEEESEQKGEEA